MRWPPWAKPESTAGAEAQEHADRKLRETVARWPEVRREVAELRKRQDENHFTDKIRTLFQGGS